MWKKFDFFQYVKQLFLRENTVLYKNKKISFNEEEYTVRQIHNEDIKHLLAIEKEVYDGELPWDKTAFFSEINAPYPKLYLLIEKDNQVVAFVGVRFKNGNGHITNIAVKKDYQKKGMATFLLKEVKKYAIIHDCSSLSLEVRLSNTDAQRLYRKFGFVSRLIKENYYQSNNESALDMVYYFTKEEIS